MCLSCSQKLKNKLVSQFVCVRVCLCLCGVCLCVWMCLYVYMGACVWCVFMCVYEAYGIVILENNLFVVLREETLITTPKPQDLSKLISWYSIIFAKNYMERCVSQNSEAVPTYTNSYEIETSWVPRRERKCVLNIWYLKHIHLCIYMNMHRAHTHLEVFIV